MYTISEQYDATVYKWSLMKTHIQRVRGRVGLVKWEHVTWSAAWKQTACFRGSSQMRQKEKEGEKKRAKKEKLVQEGKKLLCVWWDVWFFT